MKKAIKKCLSALLIGSCLTVSVAFGADWVSSQVYVGGDKVTHNGHDWEAKWWTQGDTPGASQWGPWKDLGASTDPKPCEPNCNPDPTDDTNPNPGGDLGLKVGESKVLTDAQVIERWGAIDPKYTPDGVANAVQELMSDAEFKRLFPRRYGSPMWDAFNNKDMPEYFTHQALIDAVKAMANIELRIEVKNYASRVSRFDKTTKEETLLKIHQDWNSEWLQKVTPVTSIIDYGKFLNEGDLTTRKKELAALLANLSHETTGGWSTAPDGPFAWGFYFKEETCCNDDTVGRYVQASNTEYPPTAGESYHGRGPIQLSWNYNYGYMSQVVFKDKSILLDNPDQLAHDGKLGFMTAIWFWMTPQSPKPANHDVMVGNWTPSAADISANRLPGFGVTINVINGGLECGKPGNSSVADRVGFYDKITQEFGVDPGANKDCYNQNPF